MDSAGIAALRGQPLGATCKALPLDSDEHLTIDEIAGLRWSVAEGALDFPVMTLKESALAANIELMASYCRRHRVQLAPHGKTTMAPQLFLRQIMAGAWGISAATVSQVRSFRAFGVPRVLLANVLVDAGAIRWIAGELEADADFEFLCYVDSIRGVQIMEQALPLGGVARRVPVLIELGYVGGRSGCRDRQQAAAVAARVAESPVLELRGVSGFEGLIQASSPEQVVPHVEAFLRELHELVVDLERKALFSRNRDVLVSSGGSAYFDIVIDTLGPDNFDFPVTTILRSGCYITHDVEMYELTSPLAQRAKDHGTLGLRPALELWATVWSRPEPGLAIIGFGKRDAPYDYQLPVAEKRWSSVDGQMRDVRGRYKFTALNDQHAFLQVPEDDELAVGDRLVCGISHPCGAFDKWRVLPVVDDDYHVIDAIFTLF